MTVLITLVKGMMLIATAACTLAAAAAMLGVEPASGNTGARCSGAPAPACLFTIF